MKNFVPCAEKRFNEKQLLFCELCYGSYQGLMLYKTTKSVTRKGSRFFVLRYKSLLDFAIFSVGKRYVKLRDMLASQTRSV